MAEWSAAEVNRLPDSSFLYVEPGGSKDEEGKTTPRSLRHFPYKNESGAVDLPHLRDAIGRIPQSSLPEAKKKELQAHAETLLQHENSKGDRADGGVVHRFDVASGSVKGHRTTPQGGVIVRGNLTRTGVLKYVQPDGSVRRELRHPDDVFDKDSLASLAHAPVTIDHPDVVTPKNYRDVAVGHVAETPHRDGKYVAADDIRVQDAEGVDGVRSGKLQEFSCGYSCRLDNTPGTYEGEPYDARQTGIRYNHVAMGPEGWGRAGPEVRMRLDAGSAVSGAGPGPYVRARDGKSHEGAPMTNEEKQQLEKAEKDANEAKTALETARADAEKATEGAAKLAAQARVDAARIAELEAKNKVLELQAKRDDSAKTSKEAQDRLDTLVEETVTVREVARRVLGDEWKHDGKKLDDIKREVVKELVPEFDGLEALESKALDAAYRTAIAGEDRARRDRADVQHASAQPHADAGKGFPGAEGKPEDGEDDEKDEVKKARDKMAARNKDAWKTGKKWDRKRAADAQRSN